MITLHRLGHAAETFDLNPDLIVTVEANPDTVITLTTGTKIVVAEPPERVAEEIREYRVEVLADALKLRTAARANEPASGRRPRGVPRPVAATAVVASCARRQARPSDAMSATRRLKVSTAAADERAMKPATAVGIGCRGRRDPAERHDGRAPARPPSSTSRR